MTMPPSERRHRPSQEHLTDAQLNELVDRTLAPADNERAQEHLATCVECEERYRTLLATVTSLKSAPSIMPRRSFQLTPEQAKLPEKQPGWFDRFSEWVMPGVPAIRAATLAVALLLLSVTAIDVLTHRSDTSENAGPVVIRQAGISTQAVPVQATNAEPTTFGALQESDTNAAAQQPEERSGGALAPTAASGSMASSAMESSDAAEAETGSDGEIAGGAGQPPAPPAAAAPPMQEPSESFQAASESIPEISPAASPTPASTEIATPSRTPFATASPAPPSPTPTAETSGRSGTISRWRIAEFGLLLLLVWLGVTWFGRTRVDRDSNESGSSS